MCHKSTNIKEGSRLMNHNILVLIWTKLKSVAPGLNCIYCCLSSLSTSTSHYYYVPCRLRTFRPHLCFLLHPQFHVPILFINSFHIQIIYYPHQYLNLYFLHLNPPLPFFSPNSVKKLGSFPALISIYKLLTFNQLIN